MKYLSLFSGIGGFELGIQQAYERLLDNKSEAEQLSSQQNIGSDNSDNVQGTPTCIGYSEIDKYAIQVYEKHFPEHRNFGDITKINPAELPDFDLVVGGFPCQAFSIAGKRRGFDDTRGTLFFDIARILKVKRPKFLLLENVKGLLSHDSGRTFKTIISTLVELGYDLQWQVLNAKNFGVPQNRERVFIIGCLGGFGGRKVFPIGETGQIINQTQKLSEQNSNTLQTNYSNGHSNETYIGELNYVGAIMSENNQKWLKQGKELSREFPQGQRVYNIKGISTTIASQAGGLGAKTGLYKIDDLKIRRLTPIECERLMGFPDNWTAEGTEGKISDTQRYKMCGNGVVVNVVKEIIKRLL